MTTGEDDVLEQKAREFLKDYHFLSSQLSPLLAAFAREIVQECAELTCSCCKSHKLHGIYLAVHWDEEYNGWFHFEAGNPTNKARMARCQCDPMWEAFGRKEEKK